MLFYYFMIFINQVLSSSSTFQYHFCSHFVKYFEILYEDIFLPDSYLIVYVFFLQVRRHGTRHSYGKNRWWSLFLERRTGNCLTSTRHRLQFLTYLPSKPESGQAKSTEGNIFEANKYFHKVNPPLKIYFSVLQFFTRFKETFLYSLIVISNLNT